MSQQPKIIAITGAESTGKSTLAEELSRHYKVPFESEFARDYVKAIENKYTFSDIEYIAKKQIEQYKKLIESGNKLVILDTWLLITKVWFDVVFKKVPAWVEQSILETPIDLFLVCDIDLPWIKDNVRENGGDSRIKLHKRYIEEIEDHGFQYSIVKGTGTERTQNAIRYIDRLLQ